MYRTHTCGQLNLDNCKTFVESVKKIRRAPWGMNTNFMAALDLILNTAIASEISPESLGETTLVIFINYDQLWFSVLLRCILAIACCPPDKNNMTFPRLG